MNITCTRLLEPTLTELEQIQAIYETNFPPSEQKPFDSLAPRIANGTYISFVAYRDENPGRVVAFAFLARLPRTSLAFLEYLAVDRVVQGQGLGSELFRAMASNSCAWPCSISGKKPKYSAITSISV